MSIDIEAIDIEAGQPAQTPGVDPRSTQHSEHRQHLDDEASVGKHPSLPGTGQTDHADQIADLISLMMRSLSSLKAHIVTPDGEANAIFLVASLVRNGPKRASELASSMCFDPSTVSRQVAGLVKHGLIERQADPADGRASILVPTALGRERVLELATTRSRAIRRLLSGWSQPDKAEFARLLGSYTEQIEAQREELISLMASSVELTHPAVPARPERSN